MQRCGLLPPQWRVPSGSQVGELLPGGGGQLLDGSKETGTCWMSLRYPDTHTHTHTLTWVWRQVEALDIGAKPNTYEHLSFPQRSMGPFCWIARQEANRLEGRSHIKSSFGGGSGVCFASPLLGVLFWEVSHSRSGEPFFRRAIRGSTNPFSVMSFDLLLIGGPAFIGTWRIL